jgi:predicted component of viral defense system (DUF524 family)
MRIVALRDAATLYEWWCFFEIVRAVSDVLGPAVRVDPAAATWQGAELGQGLTAYFSGGVRVEFNRSFSRSESALHRSYSVSLRPDILIETPHDRHIFDAKFAFEPRTPIDDQDDDSEDETRAGRARRWHIHKMHTYRDALDRVASVRVLYPGSKHEWYPVGPAGARDGVGALPLRVGSAIDSDALRSLLKELLPSDATGDESAPPSRSTESRAAAIR